MIGIRQNFKIALSLLIAGLCIQCESTYGEKGKGEKAGKPYSYLVTRAENAPEINAVWEKESWKKIPAVSLDNYMGERPVHFPKTNAKVSYDDDHVYVIFKVLDNHVKAVETKTHGRVWEDSCVEFFFSPGPDTERGYFNFEANCKGVFLFKYHNKKTNTDGSVSLEDCEKISIAHSLQRDVEQELTEPLEWRLEYRIPISILKKYMDVEEPDPGVVWRANFYKCADKTSHPHWLTWAPVDYPQPKFHLPEFFGRLDFGS